MFGRFFLALFVVGIIAAGLIFVMPSLAPLKHTIKEERDLDGDGKQDLITVESERSIERVEFRGEDVKAVYSPQEGVEIEIETPEGEKRQLNFKDPDDFEEFIKETKEENKFTVKKSRKKEEKDILIENGEITVKKGNTTVLFLDASNKEIYVNPDGDGKFEIKISTVGNESVTYFDADSNGEGDLISLANGRIIYNTRDSSISIDLNGNGVYDATYSPDSGNYTLNYVELIAYFGPEIVNLLKSGNFTPEFLEKRVLEIIEEKDPELYAFILKHKDDFFDFLEELKANRGIDYPATFLLEGIDSPEDTVKLYYNLVCHERNPVMLFSPVVDKKTVIDVHEAIFSAFNYTSCNLQDLRCKNTTLNLYGQQITYWICTYNFSATVTDTHGRNREIGGEFTTVLDSDFRIVWTERGVIEV